MSRVPFDLPDGDALLVVPPFAHLTWPAQGVHSLQAAARREGLRVGVLYLNIYLAARVGPALYGTLANAPMDWLLGERLFARAAWGLDALTPEFMEVVAEHNRTALPHPDYIDHLSQAAGVRAPPRPPRYEPEALFAVRLSAEALIEEAAEALAAAPYALIGASTTFEQTNPSLALLAAIHRRDGARVLALGGANCDGDQGAALAALTPATVFSGESERCFPAYLRAVLAGERPQERVIACGPVEDLDSLSPPDFSDYFSQLRAVLPDFNAPLWLSSESSRGCWWGERGRCTFCGLNGTGLAFRRRSAASVLEEWAENAKKSGVYRVALTDNILPHAAHRDLLPQVQSRIPGLQLFFEVKANLKRAQLRKLREAGVVLVQPGIEALSTPLLAHMRKGLRASNAVALLRDARNEQIQLNWNLLFGLPGDDPRWYAESAALVPLLRHLQPPMALGHAILDRFSVWWEDPQSFGITKIQPRPSMFEVFPEGADHQALSVHFAAQLPAASLDSPEVAHLEAEVKRWQAAWWDAPSPPLLHLRRDSLTDTRGLGTPPWQPLSPAQIQFLSAPQAPEHPLASWALRAKLAVLLDYRIIPLVTGTPLLTEEKP